MRRCGASAEKRIGGEEEARNRSRDSLREYYKVTKTTKFRLYQVLAGSFTLRVLLRSLFPRMYFTVPLRVELINFFDR